MIAAQDITLSLEGRGVLDRISLSLNTGELTLLIGPNGAGKSCFLRVLAGLVKPLQGQVLLEGKPLTSWPRRKLARTIAFLPQDNTSIWGLEVKDVIALGRIPHGEDMNNLPPNGREAVEEAIVTLDLRAFATRKITDLSTGERARVFLGRAMATKAPILLCDEPIAALDPAHAFTVLEALKTYARQGHIVLAILHDLPLGARYADRLVMLNRGQLVADGKPVDVLEPERVKSIFRVGTVLEKDRLHLEPV